MKPDFWNGRRVFVTGHTGFKGAWLCLWLHRLGAEVTGYALRPETEPNLFAAARVADGIRNVIGDIRDGERLTGALAEARPEVVIHMAAQSLVRRSHEDPGSTFDVNVMGTVRLLEAVRYVPTVVAVVVVTSDKCYENGEQVWGYRECDPMGGADPYSASKGCAELVTAAYRRSFFGTGAAIASARAGNVIGGGDWANDRLIPDAMRAFHAGKPLILRNPDAVRPWQHVLDPLHGYLTLAQRLVEDGRQFAEAWNFGPRGDDAVPVRRVAERLVDAWGGRACWQLHPDAASEPHEAHSLRLDCSKALINLGWRGRLALGDALEWSARWYNGFYGGADARELVAADIAAYQAVNP